MLANVRYIIKDLGITDLDEVVHKVYEMEENMLASNANPELILAKVQRQMTNLSMNPQYR